MEFPKRLLVVEDGNGDGSVNGWVSAVDLRDIPEGLLKDGSEVAVYRLARIKRVEVSRRLVKMNATDPEDEGEDAPAAPEQLSILEGGVK